MRHRPPLMICMSSTCLLIARGISSALTHRSATKNVPTYLTKLALSTSSATDGVSRLETLQALLSLRGAPGSRGCRSPNDLQPHLVPLAKSSGGNYVCALRVGEGGPLPIVESGVGFAGMKLLSLNSEHLMRRIVAESDEGEENEVIALYNENVRG